MTSARLARAVLVSAVLLHLAMLPSLWLGYLDPLFHDADTHRRGVDFFAIYQSGTLALNGDSIYGLTPPDSVPYAAPYRYLPFVAYAFGGPLNAIPARAAYWVWVVIIELMLVANARLTYRMAPNAHWGMFAAAMWFAFTPVYLELYVGQFSLLMATLILWTAVALIRERGLLAGAPWAVSLLIKTNTALLGPIFLRFFHWRVLVAAGVALIALNAPYFVWRPDDFDWFRRINFPQFASEATQRFFSNPSDFGFVAFARILWLSSDPSANDLPKSVERLIVFLVLAVSFAATFLPRRPDVIVLVAIWSGVYFLTYFAWEHHYVMLLPALALLVALRPAYRPLALFAFICLALPTPYALFEATTQNIPPPGTLLGPEDYWPAWAAILYHGVKPVPVLMLWAVLSWDAIGLGWRERFASHAAPATGAAT